MVTSFNKNKELKIQYKYKRHTFRPCHGRLPLRKYINMWPNASKSSLLLCSETQKWPSFYKNSLNTQRRKKLIVRSGDCLPYFFKKLTKCMHGLNRGPVG